MGGKCQSCGFTDVRALEIDHVQRDGWKDRQYYSGSAYYRLILNDLWTGRYALLCANCHRIKHADYTGKFELDDLADGELMELDMNNGDVNDEP